MRELPDHPDGFAFECDLDRNLPPVERAAMTVAWDGEHVVFNFSESAGESGREVYLAPSDAEELASLVRVMTGGPQFARRDTQAMAVSGLGLAVLLALIVNPILVWVLG